MKDIFSEAIKSISFRVKCNRITYIRHKFKYRKYKRTKEFTGVYDIDNKPLHDGDIVQFADCFARNIKDLKIYQIRKNKDGVYVVTDGIRELKPHEGQFCSVMKIAY